MALIILLTVRSDTKESRESSGKLKSKHKLSDTNSDGERAHKESRHESYDRDRSQTDAEKAQKRDDNWERVQHRDEKRSDVRTAADVDARLKDRSHRTDATDADGRGDSDRVHRAAERDHHSADEMISGNRSGDVHRRSAETGDERGKSNDISVVTMCLCITEHMVYAKSLADRSGSMSCKSAQMRSLPNQMSLNVDNSRQ